MTTEIVDTNVILVANGQHDGVSDACMEACIKRLLALKQGGRFAIDDAFEILSEYQNKTLPRRGTRVGDQFVLWTLQNKANPARCDQIHITAHSEREWEEFPDDASLADFDRPDRKFVAIAIGHPQRPAILQAADAKWLGWNAALRRHGTIVDFLCPGSIQGFRKAKARKRI